MKRTRETVELQPPYKCKYDEEAKPEQELKDDCMFLDSLYKQDNRIEENEEFVATKIREAENEIDNVLPTSRFKEAYSVAIVQEFKQKISYIRNKQFLLAFLRSECFDVPKAVLRLGLFLEYKLTFFGPEMLPRDIKQDNLNKEEKELLRSGTISICGVDAGGRLIVFFHFNRMRSLGFLHQKYAMSLSRLFMYLYTFEMKYNSNWDQSKGAVAIRYGLNMTLPLKHFRTIFSHFIKFAPWALPLSVTAVHIFVNNSIERSCFLFTRMLVPKRNLSKIHPHTATSAAACLSVLSSYGIDVNDLPISITGEFRAEFHARVVRQLRETESYQASISAVAPIRSEAKECFPSQLMKVLQSNSNPDAIWWSRDGTAFVINKYKFISVVLPKEFNGTKYNSFIRRLRRWNFLRLTQRIEEDLNLIEYQHNCFQRNSPHLIECWYNDLDEFPSKLMKIINSSTVSNSIWWTSNGQAFAIDIDKFSSDVLATEFEGVNNSGFLRLLKKWGFKLLSNTNESNINKNNVLFFQHSLFQKNLQLSQINLQNWASIHPDDGDSIKGENFPKKLYQILGNEKYQHAIWWQTEKTAFAFDEVEFTRNVLLVEYGGIKLESFKRSLQRWRFKKIGKDTFNPNVSIYSNPLFLKDSPQLLNSIKELKESDDGQTASVRESAENFPKKLHRILGSRKVQHAIWWEDCGSAFSIQVVNFAKDVLPEEYSGIKFGSFKRNLKRWGFQKRYDVASSKPNISVLYHPFFVRDSPELLQNWSKVKK